MKVQKLQPTAPAAPSVVNPGELTNPQLTKKETDMKTTQSAEKSPPTPKVIHCGGKVYRIHPAAEIFIEMDQPTLAALT